MGSNVAAEAAKPLPAGDGTRGSLVALGIIAAVGLVVFLILVVVGASQAVSTQEGTPPAGASNLATDRYYFVNGCVFNPEDCGKADSNTWGEYYENLKSLYNESDNAVTQPFEDWEKTHIVYVSARTGADGANNLTQAFENDESTGKIHLVGTSAGGAAIMSYLSRAMRGETTLDERVADATFIDSPLGGGATVDLSTAFQNIQAGFMKTDLQPDIGDWVNRRGILLFTVDVDEDMVNHIPVPGIDNDPAPVYPDPDTPPNPDTAEGILDAIRIRNEWHGYTGSHTANSTKEFIKEHWAGSTP